MKIINDVQLEDLYIRRSEVDRLSESFEDLNDKISTTIMPSILKMELAHENFHDEIKNVKSQLDLIYKRNIEQDTHLKMILRLIKISPYIIGVIAFLTFVVTSPSFKMSDWFNKEIKHTIGLQN